MSAQEQRDNSGKRPDGRSRGRPFEPGQSGNPGGRPRGKSVTAALRELIDAQGPESVAGPLLKAAQTGDLKAIRIVLERTEGKVPDQVEHEGTLTVRVEYADGPPGPAATPPGPGDGPA